MNTPRTHRLECLIPGGLDVRPHVLGSACSGGEHIPELGVGKFVRTGRLVRQICRALAVGGVLMSVGCAHGPEVQSREHVERMRGRVEEVERTNGRLTVRVEELERQLVLLQDRTEANRMALERRGLLRGEAVADATRPPQPAPETYYGQPSGYAAPAEASPRSRRSVGRIALSSEQGGAAPGADPALPALAPTPATKGEDYKEVVITEEEFRAFAIPVEQGESPSGAPSPASASSVASGSRQAQPPVTDERLPTSRQLRAKASGGGVPRPSNDMLNIYQDALASYRSGQFVEALAGFQSFLAANPADDYVDNALYWIGECHFGLGDFAKAEQFFVRILNELPNANKAPDAMLKLSRAQERLGRLDDARKTLKKLSERHAGTGPGQLASQRLTELRDAR